MTVRSKTILILFVTFIGISIVFQEVFDSIILDRFYSLERNSIERETGRAIKGLNAEIQDLTSQASDWSMWDDTYNFIEDRNQGFIDSNITYNSLASTGVSELLIFDNTKALVAGVNTESTNHKLSAPSPDLLNFLSQHPEILQHLSNDSVKTGLVMIGRRALMFASLPILTGQAAGPIRGTIFWSTYVNPKFVNEIRSRIDLDLRLIPLNEAASEKREVVVNEKSIVTEILDKEHITASTMIKDFFGNSIIKLSLVAPREEYAQGMKMRRVLYNTLIITGIIFSLLIYALLEMSLLSKMRKLTRELKGIADINSIKKRIKSTGNDEITEIGNNINSMLETLSKGAELLNEAKLHAETASRTKSDFLTNISHEVRTPLNGIMGMIRAVLVMEKDPDKEQYLRTALDSSQTLLDIINDILDLSKVEAHKINLENISFNIHRAAEEALRTVSLKGYEKGLDIALDIDLNIPERVTGDSLRFKQIIMNLAGNAIKFTKQGGITLSIASDIIDDSTIRLLCAVKDSGIGIPKDKKDLIFTPFSQVDTSTTRRFGGTGLGLSITKNLIELMGGKIWIESELGIGSTFHFSLQFSLDSSLPLEQGPKSILSSQHILVASSSAITRSLIGKQLRYFGAHVTESDSASNTINILDQNIDGKTPKITGLIADQTLVTNESETLLQHLTLIRDCNDITLAAIIPCHKIALQESIRILGINRYLITPYLPQNLIKLFSPDGAEANSKVSEVNVHSENTPSLRILIADDIHVNRLVLETLLRQAGHQVRSASNGREVIKILEKEHWQSGNEQPFDIILMDLQMPDLDGFATTRVIRRRERRLKESGSDIQSIPIVAVSAHELNFNDNHLIEIGFEALCPKPINPIVLNKVIAQVTGRTSSLSSKAESSSATDDRVKYLTSVLSECTTASTAIEHTPINLTELSQRFSGEEDIVFEALLAFVEECETLVAPLREALLLETRDLISARVHALKGSLANISATQIFEHARRLEYGAAHLSQSELTSVSDTLISETLVLKETITVFLSKIAAEARSAESEDQTFSLSVS